MRVIQSLSALSAVSTIGYRVIAKILFPYFVACRPLGDEMRNGKRREGRWLNSCNDKLQTPAASCCRSKKKKKKKKKNW
jgi:hypothetical protein